MDGIGYVVRYVGMNITPLLALFAFAILILALLLVGWCGGGSYIRCFSDGWMLLTVSGRRDAWLLPLYLFLPLLLVLLVFLVLLHMTQNELLAWTTKLSGRCQLKRRVAFMLRAYVWGVSESCLNSVSVTAGTSCCFHCCMLFSAIPRLLPTKK